MSVDKIILRSILSTLAAVAILIAFAFVMLVSCFPSTTMQLAYGLGMNKSSIRNAERAYKRSGDIYFIEYATSVAIASDNYEKIRVCGEKMIADEEFEGYCEEKSSSKEAVEGYEQYLYGQVCVAKYKLGDKMEAVESAFEFTDAEFPKNNAVMAVIYTAISEADSETLSVIRGKMEQAQNDASYGEDNAYFEYALGLVSE